MYSALSFVSAFTFGNLSILAIHQYLHKLGHTYLVFMCLSNGCLIMETCEGLGQ